MSYTRTFAKKFPNIPKELRRQEMDEENDGFLVVTETFVDFDDAVYFFETQIGDKYWDEYDPADGSCIRKVNGQYQVFLKFKPMVEH